MTKKAKLTEIIKCCEAHFGCGLVEDWLHGDFIRIKM